MRAHRVELDDAALVLLHSLTEGWPVGLRLSAISLREQPDPGVELITRDGRIADYLRKEVLARLNPEHLRLLSETSVVDRVCDGLVEALTGRTDGAFLLAELERSSACVFQCGRLSRWYRYHPLLADHLYNDLRRRDPRRVRELHARAAAWHADNGASATAIRHAVAAGDWPLARALARTRWPDAVLGTRRLPAALAGPRRAAVTELDASLGRGRRRSGSRSPWSGSTRATRPARGP